MTDRYTHLVRRLTESVFGGPATTPPAVRAAIGARAARIVAGEPAGPPLAEAGVPAGLEPYVDSVIRHAYKVTDEDVRRLTAAGHSDDEVFEISVAAAVGAGVGRLERALSLLKEGR